MTSGAVIVPRSKPVRKPSTKPTIRRLNATLNKALAYGLHTYGENIGHRGFFFRLMQRRPKKVA